MVTVLTQIVHQEGSSFTWLQPCNYSAVTSVSTPLQWLFKMVLCKATATYLFAYNMSTMSLLGSREQQCTKMNQYIR